MLRRVGRAGRALATPRASLKRISSQINALSQSRALSSVDAAAAERETLDLLRAVHSPEMADFYLEQFKSFKGPAFCLIKVGGEVVDDELSVLCANCSLLANAGLRPVVVHGGGPQMNRELKVRGVEPSYVEGSRVTDAQTLEVAIDVFSELNARVVGAFSDMGTKARGFTKGVFKAKPKPKEYGFVGNVVGVDAEEVLAALRNNEIPVLTSLGYDEDTGQLLNINADVAARELACALKPRRVVFTSAKGGWVDDDTGEIVPTIDISAQYDELASKNYEGRQGTLLKLKEIKLLLDSLPSTSAVAITKASSLTRELFTHTGGGTLFVKGEPIVRRDVSGNEDVKLTGRGSGVVEDFNRLSASPSILGDKASLFVNESQSAVALVRYLSEDDEMCVLEQFAVDPVDSGAAGRDALFKTLKKNFDSLLWSSKISKLDGYLNAEAESTLSDHRNDRLLSWYGSAWSDETAKSLMWSNKERRVVATNEKTRSFSTLTSSPVRVDNKTRCFSTSSSSSRARVGLLGARGYVGREFVSLLARHSRMELTVASSRAYDGKSISEVFDVPELNPNLKFSSVSPEQMQALNVDVWVLALPNGLCAPYVDECSSSQTLIDLGADFRFNDDWVYGMPERPGTRSKLKNAKRISNPGCYATGLQVGLMPFVDNLKRRPSVFGVSGYSGAGTNPSKANDVDFLSDNLLPYKLVNHVHEKECSKHLNFPVSFHPHVASFFRGISLTISAELADASKDPFAVASEFYANEPLIEVVKDVPVVKDVMKKHGVRLGGFAKSENRLVWVSTIDNLLKGAATQAMQNLNLALEFDELESIVSDD